MKKFFVFLTFVFTLYHLQATTTITVQSGELSASISASLRPSISALSVYGSMDARDFHTLRDSFPALTRLDLSMVTISAVKEGNVSYPANTLPSNAFYNPNAQMGKAGLVRIFLPATLTAIGSSALANCTALDTLNIPSNVLTVGEGALTGSSAFLVVDADNPAYASSDGMLLTRNRSQLLYCPIGKKGTLSIPAEVTSIGTSAFKGCSMLSGSLMVPSRVTTIGYHAFEGCSGFSGELTLPAGLLSVGAYAFSGCSGFSRLTLPSLHLADATSFMLASLTSLTLTGAIDARDFKTIRTNMPALEQLQLTTASIKAYTGTLGTAGSSSTTYSADGIPENAFYQTTTGKGLTSLRQLMLPKTLTSIGANAFKGCTSLDSLLLPEGLQSVGAYAFSGCDGLHALKMGTLRILASSSFSNTNPTDLTWTGTLDARDFALLPAIFPGLIQIDASDAAIAAYTGTAGTIPGRTLSYAASQLPAAAFFDRNMQKSLLSLCRFVFPNSLTSVADSAFMACSTLRQVQLPVTVTKLGTAAFMGCNQLDSMTLPASLTHIGACALAGCSGRFVLDPANATYALAAGMLTSKDGTELIQCSLSKTGALEIPSDIRTIGEKAFQGCSRLTGALVLPPSLTSIGTAAFSGCSGFTGLLSLTSKNMQVASAAFEGCTGLTTLSAPTFKRVDLTAFSHTNFSKLTLTDSIDARDFRLVRDCLTQLAEIDLTSATIVGYVGTEGTHCSSNSVYAAGVLPAQAFYTANGPNRLQSLRFPDGVTEIDSEAFRNCSGLTTLNLPTTLQKIGQGAFLDCSGLKGSLVIPSSVTEIGASAFAHCSGFTGALLLPESVVGIGALAFAGCTGFTSALTLPTTLGSIGSSAFAGCDGIPELIAANLHAFDASAFEKTSIHTLVLNGLLDARDFVRMNTYFTELCVADLSASTVSAYSGTEGTRMGGSCSYPANEIPPCSFYDPQTGVSRSSLARIVFPKNLVSVSDSAFFKCTSLMSVLLPDKVAHVGRAAFQGCSHVDSLWIPAGLTSIGKSAFAGMGGRFLVDAENTVYTVYADMLYIKDLTEVVQCPVDKVGGLSLPRQLLHIGEHAFDGCSGLTGSLILPENLLSVGAYGFAGCNHFTGQLSIPSSVSEVGEHAFDGCTGLTTLSAPSLQQVDLTAFEHANLSKLSLTSSIDARDFRLMRDRMTSLTELDLGGATITAYTGSEGTAGTGLQYYPADVLPNCAFFNPSNQTGMKTLTRVTFPAGMTEIGNEAFRACANLSELNIPTTVSVIGGGAYRGCTGLKGALIIPTSVISIGASAFEGCSGLSGQLCIPESVTALGTSAFAGCTSFTGTLTLPVTLSTVGASAFEGCTGLTELNAAVLHITPGSTFQNAGFTKVTLTGPIDARDFKTVRDHMGKLGVLDLSKASIQAYRGREGTAGTDSLDYPKSIVPDFAFYNPQDRTGMHQLTTLFLPSDLTQVGKDAFRACTGLTVVSLPPTVETIGEGAFRDCSHLLAPPFTSSLRRIASAAFQSCTSFTGTLTLPSTLSKVESYAFYDCSGLSALVLPNTLNDLGAFAFAACPGIKSLTCPSLRFAPDNAFSAAQIAELILTDTLDARDFRRIRDDFSSLQKVSLSACSISSYAGTDGTESANATYSASTIPAYSFKNNVRLTDVSLPSSLTGIDTQAFFGCSSLKSIAIPRFVTSIRTAAFARCSATFDVDAANPAFASQRGMLLDKALTKLIQCPTSQTGAVWWPETVTSIGEDAFLSCGLLTGALSFSSQVESVENRAFAECYHLSGAVILHSAQTKVGADAFAFCYRLDKLSAQNLQRVDSSAFFQTPIQQVELKGQLQPMDFRYLRDFLPNLSEINLEAAVVLPSNALPDWAFCHPDTKMGMISLEHVRMPDSLVGIGINAFRGCSNLSMPALPSSLTEIGEGAFDGCTGMQGSLTLPSGIRMVRDSTWKDCSGLRSLVLGNSVQAVGNAAFQGCVSLDTLVVPSLHMAAANSFPNDRITHLTFNSSVDARDFRRMRDFFSNLHQVDLRGSELVDYSGTEGTTSATSYSKRSIPDNAFYNSTTGKGCTALENVLLPAELDTIEAQSFRGCLGMSSIEIPSGVEFIGNNAFLDFGGPISVNEADTAYSSLNGILYNEVKTRLIQCPVCYKGTLQIPNTVTFIEDNSLMNCRLLTEVKIPVSVHDIGAEAFSGCSGLEQMHIYRDIPLDLSNVKDVFKEVSRTTCMLNVPVSSLTLYEKAPVWNEFLNSTTLTPIVVDSVQSLVLGCDGSRPTLRFRLVSGKPDQYRIVFGDTACSAGLTSTPFLPLPTADSVGMLPLTVPLNLRPGRYAAFLVLKDRYGLQSDSMPFDVDVKLSSVNLHVKFDQVVLVENRLNRYTAFQWYKNGRAVEGANGQFLREPEGLVGAYSVEVTDSAGRKYESCPLDLNLPAAETEAVQVYPNPVVVGQAFQIRMSHLDANVLQTSKMTIYSVDGSKVYEKAGLAEVHELTLQTNAGLYLGSVQMPDGRRYAFEIILTNRK